MSDAIRPRLRAAMKKAGAISGERRGYTLEQLVRAANGEPLGEPQRVLKPGEVSLEELIKAAVSNAAHDWLAQHTGGGDHEVLFTAYMRRRCWSGRRERRRYTRSQHIGRRSEPSLLRNRIVSMTFTHLSHDDIRRAQVPGPAASWEEIETFALTFDGYAYVGKPLGDLANRHRENGTLPSDLDGLRGILFFEQRRWRHVGGEPDEESMHHIRDVLEAIRNALREM